MDKGSFVKVFFVVLRVCLFIFGAAIRVVMTIYDSDQTSLNVISVVANEGAGHHNNNYVISCPLKHTHTYVLTHAADSSATSPQKTSDEYKVEEYFEYTPSSYYEIENNLTKYRLEQPVPGIKY